METPPQHPSVKARSFVEALISSPNAPWRAKSVLLALIVVLAGGALWIRTALKGQPAVQQQNTMTSANNQSNQNSSFNQRLPLTVRAGLSYIGGFLIGWTFRRFIRIAVALTGLVLLLVGLGKYAGCDIAPTQAKVKEGSAFVQREAKVAREYLKRLLPLASAGAVGTFLGFRRKDNHALSRN